MTPEITAEFVWSHIPKRPRESNKGSFGAVLAVAGSRHRHTGKRRTGAGGGVGTPAGMLSLPL